MAILFVDPDLQEAHRLAAAVRDFAIVGVVSTAAAALGAMRQLMPAMVVTELDLPDTSGLQFITALQQNAATRHVLVIVTTHRRGMPEKIAALQAGADDYLVKPVDVGVFRTHVALVSRFRQVLPR
jgi:DNA-binding response OmpR family regulator